MHLNTKQLKQLTDVAIDAARKAGQFISKASKQPIAVERKSGGDTEASQVVTEVDRKAQEIILSMLKPSIEQYDLGILTEESEDDNSRFEKDYFWCIDPLDGTLSFIESRPGYSVSIALVSKEGISQLGVIYDPVEEALYQATLGCGAMKNGEPIKVTSGNSKLTLYSDRSFLDQSQFDQIYAACTELSLSLKLTGFEMANHGGGAMNATWAISNAPSCYFKFPKKPSGGGSLWDYAASSCVALEAGGHVSDIYGDRLDLNRKDGSFMNHKGILYASDTQVADGIMAIFQSLNP
jgi:fructose-1,6-bisphosphatase/inositol monophosphatase family enzyme